MLLPAAIDELVLEEVLGEGACGRVYAGVRTGPLGFRRAVAVKILTPERALQRASVEALSSEARILGAIDHPNVVRARDFRRVRLPDGTWSQALVMDLVRGGPVSTLRGCLAPVPLVLSLLAQGCDALRAVHRTAAPGRCLVHRDVKPENLLLTASGHLVLIDFGVAVETDGRTPPGASGMTVGSPPYMSPEQVAGEALDGRSDLHTLGSVAFELLTGERYVEPIAGPPSPQRALASVLRTRWSLRRLRLLEALSEPAPHGHDLLPPAADRVIDLLGRLLAADPARRYRSAEQALRATQAVQAALVQPAEARAARDWLIACLPVTPKASMGDSEETAA